jgi:hypothetical protein
MRYASVELALPALGGLSFYVGFGRAGVAYRAAAGMFKAWRPLRSSAMPSFDAANLDSKLYCL